MRLQAIRPLHSLLHSNVAVSSALQPWSVRRFASALVDKQQEDERITKVVELANEQAVRVTFEDGATAKFHKLWLRDHCRCEHCMHPETRQRQLDTASILMNTPFHRLQVTNAGGAVAIDWDAPVRGTRCTASEFDAQWLRDHAYALEGGNADDEETAPYPKSYRQPRLTTQKLWAGADFKLPTHDYNKCVDNIEPLMRDLYFYGLVRVSNTPNSMEATEKFSKKIGFIFNCAAQAGEGGESRYVDAFHVVETLRKENPEAFRVLSTTPLPYFTVDNDAHLATMEPLIRVDYAGNVVQFRHNDYDRAPLTHLSFEEVGEFYKAHRKLLEVMRRPEMEFCMKLQVGDMVVVDNQRVMHGRHAFQGGDRALIGCYIGRTEYESRLRVLGII
ncbi:arabinan endo-1 [Phytophthora nicotianae]|uniref:trimethyllysine dioxygenase n=1 Tax=Phytophthora nicotianae TaxID=4792 RepID=A0A0W8D253_PHYNI|nr:arabinan endo-1 [Phytophthora nicotianae]